MKIYSYSEMKWWKSEDIVAHVKEIYRNKDKIEKSYLPKKRFKDG